MLLIAIVGAALSVDAYSLFGTRLLSESAFPHATRFRFGADRMAKAIEISRDRDTGKDIVFVGTSRVAFGFDLDAPPLAGLKTFNAALSGAQAVEIAKVATYAADHWPGLHRIVWGLDYDSFFGRDDVVADFPDSGFAGAPLWPAYARNLFAYDQMTLNYKILRQALTTGHVIPDMKNNGQFLYDPGVLARAHLQGAYLGEMRGGLRDLVEGKPFYAAHRDARIAQVFATIAALKARGIDIDLILTPQHITRLALYRQIGLLDSFDDWKRHIAQAAAAADAAPGPGGFRAYDFALFHPIMSEDFPTGPDQPEPRFVYDPTHMRPIVGASIMARLQGQSPPIPEAEGFGLPLAESVLPQFMTDQRAQLEAWVASHADTMATIDKLVQTYK